MIALHWNGEFLPFPEVTWNVAWGEWIVRGNYGDYSVRLEGKYDGHKKIPVKCPTNDGMKEIAFETFHGVLRVRLYNKGRLVLDDICDKACLEVGGIPWLSKTWIGESAMKEPIKSVAMNIDLERKASDILQLASVFIEIPGL